MKNQSMEIEFILVGISSLPELRLFLLVSFLCIYVTALVGNSLIFFTICASQQLHTPMYFFLGNLSVLDALCTSTIVPKMLANLYFQRAAISFLGCMAQMYLFTWALVSEALLLALMAFDRYIAICHPLHYPMVMRSRVCIGMAGSIWAIGISNSAVHTSLAIPLSFCHSFVIDHFFCELPPILKLSCSDTHLNEALAFCADVIFGVGSCSLILVSYGCIIRTVLNIRSSEGKKKAFSTCSSHLTVVSFYYSTVIYTYIRPTSNLSLGRDKVITALYSVIIPMLNPIIYSFRNREVKGALQRLLGGTLLFPPGKTLSFSLKTHPF
ncbi:olfactory receptor 13G1-like [Gracilinanus agilis]|uniref:olfactory receptor 13G1-like n=1 Tax=Gracilinanus agilis TaxID=191870 RepID=UPI001CFC8ABB|nr:olfactory receptor 13G1-like [Gracilinanus agilis]